MATPAFQVHRSKSLASSFLQSLHPTASKSCWGFLENMHRIWPPRYHYCLPAPGISIRCLIVAITFRLSPYSCLGPAKVSSQPNSHPGLLLKHKADPVTSSLRTSIHFPSHLDWTAKSLESSTQSGHSYLVISAPAADPLTHLASVTLASLLFLAQVWGLFFLLSCFHYCGKTIYLVQSIFPNVVIFPNELWSLTPQVCISDLPLTDWSVWPWSVPLPVEREQERFHKRTELNCVSPKNISKS